MVYTKRNADGQFPKRFDLTKKTLYQQMGFSKDEIWELVTKWNALRDDEYRIGKFLQEADMIFTKHELMFLFTICFTRA